MGDREQKSNVEFPTSPFGYFWYVTKPYKWWAFSAFILVTFAAGIGQGTSYFFKIIVDAVERSDYNTALIWGLMYPVVVFFVQVLYRFSGYTTMPWVQGTEKKGYDDLSAYIFNHSNSFFADRFAGSILSKITNIVNAVDSIIPEVLWTHWNSFVVFVVTLILIWSVDPMSGVIFIVLLGVLFIANYRMSPKKAVLSKEYAEMATELRGRIVDVVGNVAAVRQYVQKERELKQLNTLTTKRYSSGCRSWMYTEKMLFVNSCILFVFAFLMFWSLTHQWSEGTISAGDFILVLSLVAQITGTLLFVGRSFNMTARSFGELKEGLEDLIIPYEVVDRESSGTLNVREAAIVWNRVSFTYGENKVFKNFNLAIKPGERIGLVGQSGAGKTTFVSLLLRQHDLNGGEITIDGQNIAEVTQDSLRKNIAVVPQEPLLFHRSIAENISYGKPNATQKEIEDVAKKAQAHSFIKTLPEEYKTLVGERGVKLSGGQRQRIAIARAMLKNAPILVLDEATSALDSESEVAIQKALHELMEGKTVVAIAHRLSTLREMDRILVLDGGKIVEDGTHEELQKQDGVYARLWTHQAGGFLGE